MIITALIVGGIVLSVTVVTVGIVVSERNGRRHEQDMLQLKQQQEQDLLQLKQQHEMGLRKLTA